MYQGSLKELSTNNFDTFGFGASIILHLSQRFSKAGHNLLMDTFFYHVSRAGNFQCQKHQRQGQTGLANHPSSLTMK
jgi:hypothetical protein